MKLRKLRTRLILTYSSIIVLGFIGLTLIAGGQIARSANEDFDRAVSESASLIARSLGDSVEHWLNGENDGGSLTNTLNGLSLQEGGEVTLLGSRGQVLLTTARKYPSAAELLTYPEVLAALRGQAAHERRTSTTGVQYVYATAPIMDDEEPVAVVIVTAPLRDVGGLVNQRWIALASGVGILMWLTVAASILLAGSLTHPLEQLRTSALRLASGDLDTHIEIRQSGEIGDLAEA
ncbi:MAG: HAMP domain-containing protein, partial [Anaerolineae bacterium]|nr:HAMP domain-containing protein [Anaerolineae bacterium]